MANPKTPAKAQETRPEVEEPMPLSQVDTWESMSETADEILGNDLAKDDILDALVGVPIMVTRVVFRPAETANRKSYVSCEAVIAPKHELERRKVNLSALPFDPGDHVVFNDGSTGIYRQIVAYLHAKGFIALPQPITTGGSYGESSYDLSPQEWEDVNAGDMRFTESGDSIYVANVRLLAKRGIRISDYENEWTKDGKTRYLA